MYTGTYKYIWCGNRNKKIIDIYINISLYETQIIMLLLHISCIGAESRWETSKRIFTLHQKLFLRVVYMYMEKKRRYTLLLFYLFFFLHFGKLVYICTRDFFFHSFIHIFISRLNKRNKATNERKKCNRFFYFQK